MMSNGNGNSSIKYVENNKWQIISNNVTAVEVTPNETTFAGDLSAPGGLAVTYNFFKNRLLQNESAQMTGSVVVTGSAANLYQAYLRFPTVRNGSILGLALYSADSSVSTAAVSASVTVDGVNVGTPLVLSAGSNAVTTFSKDTYTFSGSQVIGVSITGSAEMVNSLAASGSWTATVLVEM